MSLAFKAGGFMLKYERGTEHSPNVQSMVDMLAAGSKGAGLKLSELKLPIGGLAETLKHVQLDVVRLDLVGSRVTHAEVSVKLRGANATQDIADGVRLSGASVDVVVKRPVGRAASWAGQVSGSWKVGSEGVRAVLSTDGRTTRLVGTATAWPWSGPARKAVASA